jgi:hypothetical protein
MLAVMLAATRGLSVELVKGDAGNEELDLPCPTNTRWPRSSVARDA